MSAHTPGPWFADIQATYGYPAKPTPNIAVRPILLDKVVNVTIARVPRSSQAEANARLIAAAPDLLAELRKLVDLVSVNCRQDPDSWLANARTVIAKASGDAP